MTPAAAVERLMGLARFGIRPGLERIQALLETLGGPERGLRVLHVGGTNGKGSVSALAEAILRAAGLRTGLYTSPHLLDLRERIRIGSAPLAPEALAETVARLAPQLDAGGVTFFEAMTAVAFAAFRDARVDAAVVEVGMGGRWDATNVGTPPVAVLTRIDYDHQAYLGSRLEEIAAEKAAIIRGRVALSAAQVPSVLEVIEARCRAAGTPLLLEGREIRVEVRRSDLRGHRLRLAGPGWALDDLDVALPGLYQRGNAALAVAAVHAFAAATGFAVDEAAIRAGCAGVRWPGRFQVLPGGAGRPTVVLDGAHNPAGAAALAASLAAHFPGARLTLVIGISTDKDRAGILKALAPLAHRILLTAAANPRATPPAELAADCPPGEAEVTRVEAVGAALARALEDPRTDLVCVTGSLFVVADALRWLIAAGLAEPGGS